MTVWMLATLAMLPALVVPVLAACRGSAAGRLVAVQLATVVAGLILSLMTFAFDQSTFMDLALTLAFVSLPGTLATALFVERWL